MRVRESNRPQVFSVEKIAEYDDGASVEALEGPQGELLRSYSDDQVRTFYWPIQTYGIGELAADAEELAKMGTGSTNQVASIYVSYADGSELEAPLQRPIGKTLEKQLKHDGKPAFVRVYTPCGDMTADFVVEGPAPRMLGYIINRDAPEAVRKLVGNSFMRRSIGVTKLSTGAKGALRSEILKLE